MTRAECEEVRRELKEPLCECPPSLRDWYGIAPYFMPTPEEFNDRTLAEKNFAQALPYQGLVLCFACCRIADREDEPVGQVGMRCVVDLFLNKRESIGGAEL